MSCWHSCDVWKVEVLIFVWLYPVWLHLTPYVGGLSRIHWSLERRCSGVWQSRGGKSLPSSSLGSLHATEISREQQFPCSFCYPFLGQLSCIYDFKLQCGWMEIILVVSQKLLQVIIKSHLVKNGVGCAILEQFG